MLHSMTAFTRHTETTDAGEITWEIRSVNHRYCDIQLHINPIFQEQESTLRTQIKDAIQRGKIDCHLHIQTNESQASSLNVNQTLLDALIQQCDSIANVQNLNFSNDGTMTSL